jgi:hypothetical protein
MTTNAAVYITADEALAAIRDAAWIQYDYDKATCGHPGCTEHPDESRRRIHTQSSHGFGADWDLDKAEAFVRTAQRCAWVNGLVRHALGVIGADGRAIYFDAKRPTDGAA